MHCVPSFSFAPFFSALLTAPRRCFLSFLACIASFPVVVVALALVCCGYSLVPGVSASSVSGGVSSGSVAGDGGEDLFPIKVQPVYTSSWTVEYLNTYKVEGESVIAIPPRTYAYSHAHAHTRAHTDPPPFHYVCIQKMVAIPFHMTKEVATAWPPRRAGRKWLPL